MRCETREFCRRVTRHDGHWLWQLYSKTAVIWVKAQRMLGLREIQHGGRTDSWTKPRFVEVFSFQDHFSLMFYFWNS